MLCVPYLRVTLPASSQSPSEARRQVGKMCRGLSTSLAETAQLLVSELVTNALVHGRGAVGLRMSRNDRVVRVEVSDTSAQPARPVLHPGVEDESGRGLFLVSALANSWGSEPNAGDGGKTVWFELHLRDSLTSR